MAFPRPVHPAAGWHPALGRHTCTREHQYLAVRIELHRAQGSQGVGSTQPEQTPEVHLFDWQSVPITQVAPTLFLSAHTPASEI